VTVSPDRTRWWSTVTRYQWLVFALVSSAWLFDTLDQRLFSLARIAALSDLMQLPGPDLAVQAVAKKATSIFLIGWGVGGLTIGALGDRYGRVRFLMISVALYSVCSAATALAQSADAFIILRLFTGIGIGGVFGLAVTILSDEVSGKARLAMLALLQVLSTVGNVMAALLKMLIDKLAAQGLLAHDDVWRTLFLIGALPIIIVAIGAWRLREPEPWVRLKVAGQLPRGALGAYAEIFRSAHDRRNLLIGSILAISGVVGLWAIGEFAVDFQDAAFTRYYEAAHAAPEVAILVAQAKNWAYMLQMLGGAAGMLIFSYFAGRIGRRPTFMGAFAAAGAITVLAYFFLETPADAYWMMPLMGAAQFSVFAGYSIYLPELFGARVRGTGVSFAYNLGRFAAAGGGFLSAMLTTQVFAAYDGVDALRYSAIAMCVIFIPGIIAAWFAPETRGAEDRP
jgi:MFS family permease